MTLFKQISIIFSVFIILIMGSVMYLNFNSANNFVQNQLYATSEDTATSLGLSLSMNIPADGKDLSTMETMINAIFDRGYYEKIMLQDMEGSVLIKNKNLIKVKNIPEWFIDIVDFELPTAKTQISAGWIPYGILSVKMHSGYAYEIIWNIFINLMKTFTLLTSIILIILYFVLKFVLKPLTGVEQQAVAITNNDFIIQDNIPYTTEFKNVVIGMNKMVKKVKDIFDHESLMVKKYNDLLYNDAQTGMGNRKFFLLRLSSLLNQHNVNSSGTLILFAFNNFSETKKTIGYNVLSTYIKKVAKIFYETTHLIEENVVTRLNDSEFSMILPKTDYVESQKILDEFMLQVKNALCDDLKKINSFYISVGATYFNEQDSQKDILSRADFALSSAKMKDENNIYFHEQNEDANITKLGKEEWKKLIMNALKTDGIKLALQAVKDNNNKTYHKEAYLRMSDENGIIYPARVFMPMLNTLNLIDEVDKKVITLAFKLAHKGDKIAINIDTSFIKNSKNIYWLEELLKSYSEFDLNISFESSNYAILNDLETCTNFSKLIQEQNCKFGIDNFNITDKSLGYLQKLKPNYIKANRSFYIDMYNKGESSSYESFNILTKSLDIKIIATGVNNEEESNQLKEIPIYLQQGRYIGEPTI